MIVLDASVLIAHLDPRDVHYERARSLLDEVGGERLAASIMTLAEVLVAPAGASRLDRAVTTLDEMGIRILPLDNDDHVRLAVLRAESGLKLPDCCVLIAASQVRGAIATFDARLGAVASSRGHLVIPG